MKPICKQIIPGLFLALIVLSSCTKNNGNPDSGFKHPTVLKTLSDSDSTYIAHIQVDSMRHDSLRSFTVYCFLTTGHGSTRLTVPGNFMVSSTVFYGTPIQSSGSVTIYTGYNYGSSSFSTTTTYPLTFTNSTPSPSSFNGIPIIVEHDPGVFTP